MTNPHSNQFHQPDEDGWCQNRGCDWNVWNSPSEPSCPVNFGGRHAVTVQEQEDMLAAKLAAPQPANTLPTTSRKCPQRDCDFEARTYTEMKGHMHDAHIITFNPTTPIEGDHKAVNAWMMANGWRLIGTTRAAAKWYKEDFEASQDLAAEMYRMSEVRANNARIDELHQLQKYWLDLSMVVPRLQASPPQVKQHIVERLAQLAATNPRKEIEG